MKRGRGIRKGKLCPHCEVVVKSSYDSHVARCKLFAPVERFVELWNKYKSIDRVASEFGVCRNKADNQLAFLRRKTSHSLPIATYADKRSRVIKAMEGAKNEDSSNRCKGCTILCDGELCHFCIDVKEGRDILSRRPALIMEAIGG